MEGIQKIDARECLYCGTIFETFEEAVDCHPPKPVEAYKCPKCDMLYEEHISAVKCCA